jgi:hypothetical protein
MLFDAGGRAGGTIETKENQAQVGGVGGRIELVGKCTPISAILFAWKGADFSGVWWQISKAVEMESQY